MSSGYVPVFSSIFTGTLCGKYPDTAAWMFLLALADKNGVVDMTPQAISALTGMPVDDLVQCIARFEQPDAYSRSTAEEGRRLVRIDPNRPWGWRVVNHGKYRERARKQAWDSERTASGRDADRKRESRRVPMPPDCPRSQTQTQTQTQTEEKRESFAPPPGLDSESFSRWEKYREEIGKPLTSSSVFAAQRKLVAFGTEQAAVVEQSIVNGWHGLFHLKKERNGGDTGWKPPKSIAQLEAEEAARGSR